MRFLKRLLRQLSNGKIRACLHLAPFKHIHSRCFFLTEHPRLLDQLLHKLSDLVSHLAAEMLKGLSVMPDSIPQMIDILHDINIRKVFSLLKCAYNKRPSIQGLKVLSFVSHDLSFLKIRNAVLPSAHAGEPARWRSDRAMVDVSRIPFPGHAETIKEAPEWKATPVHCVKPLSAGRWMIRSVEG